MEKREPKRPGGKADRLRLDSTSLVDRVRDEDVLLGRGKRSYNHTGNLRFRELVLQKATTYKECMNKPLRRKMAMSIMERVESGGGRFLRPHDPEKKNDGAKAGQWVIVSKSIAMTKVKQALRDSGEIAPAQTPLPRRDSLAGSADPQHIPAMGDPSSVPSQLASGSDRRLATFLNPVASDRDLVDSLNQRRLQQLLLAQWQARELSLADQLLRQRVQWTSQLTPPPSLSDRAIYPGQIVNTTLPTTVPQRSMLPEWLQPNVGVLNQDLASLINAASRSLPQHSMRSDLLLSNNNPLNAGNHVSLMDVAARRLALESMLSRQRLLQSNPSVVPPQSSHQLNRVHGPTTARIDESNLAAGNDVPPPAQQQQTQDDSGTSDVDTQHADKG